MRNPSILLALSSTLSLAAQQQHDVSWRGAAHSLDELRAQCPAAGPVAARWQTFAAEQHYRLVLADDGLVLAVLPDSFAMKSRTKEHAEVSAMLDLLRDATAVVQPLLGLVPAEQAPVVVVAARDRGRDALLQHVASLDPRLTAWASGPARQVTGFILSEPLVAAWVDDAGGLEEWHRHNELIHRAAQLLLRSRAPQLPPWFALGFGWHVEETVLGGIYCFPHRSGFVWATEHTGWGLALAHDLQPARRKKANLPATLTLGEIAGWEPAAGSDKTFERSKALLAFGLVRFLAHERPHRFAEVASQLDAAIQKGWKRWISEHEWTTDPDYRLPEEQQLEALRMADPEVLAQATKWFLAKKANERRRPPHAKR